MPEKVISGSTSVTPKKPKKKKAWKPSRANEEPSSDDDDSLKDVIKVHAYQFFIGHGGKEEDWGEDEERGVREEMLNKWRQSDWGKHLHARRRKKDSGGSKWVGSSFEVGNFLGVNVLDTSRRPSSSSVSRMSLQSATPAGRPSNSTAVQTFVTAPSHRSVFSNDLERESSLDCLSPLGGLEDRTASASSSTALLQPSSLDRAHSDFIPRAAPTPLFAATKSEGILNTSAAKGKGRVHYAISSVREEDSPASPTDVLARTGMEVEDTSAGAVEAHAEEEQSNPSDVVMRGNVELQALLP